MTQVTRASATLDLWPLTSQHSVLHDCSRHPAGWSCQAQLMVAVASGPLLGDLGSSYFGCKWWDSRSLHLQMCVFGQGTLQSEPGPPLLQKSPCTPPLALPAGLTGFTPDPSLSWCPGPTSAQAMDGDTPVSPLSSPRRDLDQPPNIQGSSRQGPQSPFLSFP